MKTRPATMDGTTAVMHEALVSSAIENAARAEELGLSHDALFFPAKSAVYKT